VVLDCYQSAGALPFSLSELDVDFAVGGSVKWLCGGPGAGWLYVRPDLQETFEPRFVGWQGDRAPFDFRPGPIAYAPGIWRFLSGTPNVPGLYAARAGYRIVREVGVPAIREKSLRMTQWIIDMADELEIPVTSDRSPQSRGGTVTLDVGEADRVVAALGYRRVIVDARPDVGIRVGPHFYNTGEDLSRLRESLIEILKR
jgi:kynureninase